MRMSARDTNHEKQPKAVVQQRAGLVTGGQGKGLSINESPALEAEADQLGARAARGETVSVNGAGSDVQRKKAEGVPTGTIQRNPDPSLPAVDASTPAEEEEVDDGQVPVDLEEEEDDDDELKVERIVNSTPMISSGPRKPKKAQFTPWERAKSYLKRGLAIVKEVFLLVKAVFPTASRFVDALSALSSVIPVVSAGFAGLTALLSLNAARKAMLQTRHLEMLEAVQDEATFADAREKETALKLIRYGKRQKRSKSVKQTLRLVGSVLLVVAAILAILSNPIGWFIGLGGAGLAMGIALYRLGRNQMKKRQGQLGKERTDNSRELYYALRQNDPPKWAIALAEELHLDPTRVADDPAGYEFIKAKLKSM